MGLGTSQAEAGIKMAAKWVDKFKIVKESREVRDPWAAEE
jgi:hypothetical protein